MYSNLNRSVVTSLLSGLGIFAVIVLIFYILQCFALMKMAKTKKISHPWLAFFPYANTYLYGKIAFEKKYKTIILLTLNLLASSFIAITYLKFFASALKGYTQSYPSTNIFQIAYVIYNFYATYNVYKQFSDKAVIMLVFTILSCGLLTPIFLFAIRNNKLDMLNR